MDSCNERYKLCLLLDLSSKIEDFIRLILKSRFNFSDLHRKISFATNIPTVHRHIGIKKFLFPARERLRRRALLKIPSGFSFLFFPSFYADRAISKRERKRRETRERREERSVEKNGGE